MWRSRLLWRLLAVNIFAVLAFVAVSQAYIELNLRQALRAEAMADLESRARLAFMALRQAGGQVDLNEVGRRADARVTLIRRDGVVLADTDADGRAMESHLQRLEIQQALVNGVGMDTRIGQTLRREMDYVAVTDPKDADAPLLRVARPTEVTNARLNAMRQGLLAIAGALLIVGSGLALFATHLIRSPIERLRAAAEGMTEGRLDAPVATAARAAGGDFSELEAALHSVGVQMRQRVNELEGQSRELASIMENVSDGLLLVDPQGEVALVNRAATRLLGLSAAQLEGKPLWQNLRHPEIHDLLDTLREVDGPSSVKMDLGAGASTRTLEIVATPMFETAEGEKRSVLLVRDRTEDRRLEQMRRDFVADVSHELKTPLTSIKAYVETLLDGAMDDVEARGPFLEKIRNNAERLTKLVSDILDISRLEGSPTDDARQRMDLNLLVERVLAQFKERAERRRVTLEWVPAAAPAFAVVNDEDLSEAVENLIDNAVKYTPEGGKVSVSVSTHDDRHEIAVSDTGIGIPRESLPRVFERFFRVDKARSRALGGTGLGLSIVKHVALRHGGRIDADSELGKGSVFRISLPAA